MEFWKGLFGLFVLGLVVEASIVKREESEKKSHHWSYHREYGEHKKTKQTKQKKSTYM